MKNLLINKLTIPKPGRYIVAVSGGVDSCVLLDLLLKKSRKADLELIVVHFDHGMRQDSQKDRLFVQNLAKANKLPFEYKEGNLGNVNEATARKHRYQFLYDMMAKHEADGIILAHHLNDRIETSVFNILRGSNRIGAAPLKTGPILIRPLLKINKAELKKYAKYQKLTWQEDTTNSNTAITRNFIRHELIPIIDKLNLQTKPNYISLLNNMDQLNQLLNRILEETLVSNAMICKNQIEISKIIFQNLSPSAIEHLLAFSITKLKPDFSLQSKSLRQLALLVKQDKVGKRQTFGPKANCVNVEIGYDRVTIRLGRTRPVILDKTKNLFISEINDYRIRRHSKKGFGTTKV